MERENLNLTDKEVAAAFSEPQWPAVYPPVLSLEQAAELLQVPLQTLYKRRAKGALDKCSCRVGKHVRIFRDRLLDRDIARDFCAPPWCDRYPPVLSLQQAAELLQVPLQTLYQWRSRGLLPDCCRKIGGHVRVFRNRLIKLVFNTGINS